jgi:uridylate kinase
MEFEEFVRKMTKSAKDSGAHIMAFISDGERVIFTYQGNPKVITEAVAVAMADRPDAWNTIKDAVDLIYSRDMKVTEINNEDQMDDYLIDLYLNNKDLNNGGQGL